MKQSLLTLAALTLATSTLLAAPKQPNIILLLADDLGHADLHTGPHASAYHQTPHLDRLAKQGLTLTSFHMNPNCAPSRAALFTGQQAPRNGVYNVGSLDRGEGRLTPPAQRQDIRPEAVTLAETLKSAGYATAHVAKFHVGKPADILAHHGFDANYGGGHKGDGGPKGFFAVREASSPTGWTFRNLGPEMNPFATPYTREYIEKNLKPFATGNDPSPLAGTPKHLTDATADAALEFMSKHVAASADKPFFINVAYNAVHTGIVPRPDLDKKFKSIKSKDPRHDRADYAALLEGLDQSVGRILAFLDDPNADGDTSDSIASNTLVLFTSDNGGFAGATSNAPLRGFKGMFYEGGLRVPFIARLPGAIPAGSSSDILTHGIDLYPTLAQLAGAELPSPDQHPLDGQPFTATLKNPTSAAPRPTPLLYHFPGYLDTRAYPCSVVLHDLPQGRHKLLYSYEDQHYELYNLTADPNEQANLLATPPNSATLAIANNLRTSLTDWLTSTKASLPTDPATKQPVPLPIPLETAMKNGNRSTREVHPPKPGTGAAD